MPPGARVKGRVQCALEGPRRKLLHPCIVTCFSMLIRYCPVCLALALAALLAGCTGGQATRQYIAATGGYSHRGETVIGEYRCGECHQIPGIRHASGVFGPPLNAIARRSYLAGEFPNTPQNLIRWVRVPQSMKPKTAMPDLGLSDQQARDVAAYLETLR